MMSRGYIKEGRLSPRFCTRQKRPRRLESLPQERRVQRPPLVGARVREPRRQEVFGNGGGSAGEDVTGEPRGVVSVHSIRDGRVLGEEVQRRVEQRLSRRLLREMRQVEVKRKRRPVIDEPGLPVPEEDV